MNRQHMVIHTMEDHHPMPFDHLFWWCNAWEICFIFCKGSAQKRHFLPRNRSRIYPIWSKSKMFWDQSFPIGVFNLPHIDRKKLLLENRFGIMKFIGKRSVFMEFFHASNLNKNLLFLCFTLFSLAQEKIPIKI